MTQAFITPVLTIGEMEDAMALLKGASPDGMSPISQSVALHVSSVEQIISRELARGSVGNPTESHYGRDGLRLAILQAGPQGSHRLRIEVPHELTGSDPFYGSEFLATFKPLVDRARQARKAPSREAVPSRGTVQTRDPRYDWRPRRR